MTTNRRRRLIVWIVAIALSVATIIVPAPASIPNNIFHIALFLETMLAGIAGGAGVLFLLGLQNYRQRLRSVYLFIAIGMLVYAITQLQLPVLEAFDLLSSPYVSDGWLNILYVLSGLLILLGVIKYANLLQVRSAILSPSLIIVVVVSAAVLTPMLPHQGNFYASLRSLYTNVGITAVASALFSFAAAGVLIVKRAAGPAYTSALAWSFLGISMMAVAEICTEYFQLAGFDNWFVNSGLFFVPYLIGVVCNLRAASEFNDIVHY
jgi:hypothetical protein